MKFVRPNRNFYDTEVTVFNSFFKRYRFEVAHAPNSNQIEIRQTGELRITTGLVGLFLEQCITFSPINDEADRQDILEIHPFGDDEVNVSSLFEYKNA